MTQLPAKPRRHCSTFSPPVARASRCDQGPSPFPLPVPSPQGFPSPITLTFRRRGLPCCPAAARSPRPLACSPQPPNRPAIGPTNPPPSSPGPSPGILSPGAHASSPRTPPSPPAQSVVAAELLSPRIGAQNVEVGSSGVSFQGTQATGYRANLWLRSAIRVLVRLASADLKIDPVRTTPPQHGHPPPSPAHPRPTSLSRFPRRPSRARSTRAGGGAATPSTRSSRPPRPGRR